MRAPAVHSGSNVASVAPVQGTGLASIHSSCSCTKALVSMQHDSSSETVKSRGTEGSATGRVLALPPASDGEAPSN